MNESFYQLYKSGRDMVEQFRHKDLDPIFREFIEMQESIAKTYDKKNMDCYERWQKERNNPPLLFRFHRGGLDESLETVIEIDSFFHLKSHVCADWHDIETAKILITPYYYDRRIDWDTHMVRIVSDTDTYPVGFLNRRPDWSNPDE